jgi:hypothetical protein
VRLASFLQTIQQLRADNEFHNAVFNRIQKAISRSVVRDLLQALSRGCEIFNCFHVPCVTARTDENVKSATHFYLRWVNVAKSVFFLLLSQLLRLTSGFVWKTAPGNSLYGV